MFKASVQLQAQVIRNEGCLLVVARDKHYHHTWRNSNPDHPLHSHRIQNDHKNEEGITKK